MKISTLILFLTLVSMVIPVTEASAQDTIFTFAGGGGLPSVPTLAPIGSPTCVAVGPDGAVYVGINGGSQVVRVSAQGSSSLVAGTGVSGSTGDGGPAIMAEFTNVSSTVCDALGNLYLADTGSNRIRKIDASGTISTIAGTGVAGYSGDGGAALQAKLNGPTSLAIDSAGKLYFFDSVNNRIRAISSSGTMSTVLGDGTFATLSCNGIAVDPSGNIYIADGAHSCVKLWTASTGTISVFAGLNGSFGFGGDGGSPTSARFKFPNGVCLDASGNVYISDQFTFRIREVSAGKITTIAGNGNAPAAGGELGPALGDGGQAKNATLGTCNALAVDQNGGVYIVTAANDVVRKVSQGIINDFLGNYSPEFGGDGHAAIQAQLNAPNKIIFDSSGNLYVADTNNGAIRKIDSNSVITSVAGNGNLGFSGDTGPAVQAMLFKPHGIAFDSAGNLFIADTANDCTREITLDGDINTVAGNPGTPSAAGFGDGGPALAAGLSSGSIGLAIDGASNIIITDTNSLREFSVGGTITTICNSSELAGSSGDGGSATSAKLFLPTDLAVDHAGNLVIADASNNCIRRISKATGIITTIAGTGTAGFTGDGGSATAAELSDPQGIFVTSTGVLYIADSGNNRIRMVSTSGVITTIAGDGTSGFAGDGGDPLLSELTAPSSVAVDTAGNVYIADTGNNRIRAIRSTSQTQTITFPAIGPQVVGEAPFPLTATASSGLTPVFSIVSGPGSLTGSTLTIVGPGTIVVAADQPGNFAFLAAPEVSQSITVTGSTGQQMAQTITFATVPAQTVGAGPVTLSASASSGLPVSFSIISGPATLSGTTLTITGVGTIVVAADQPGNLNYTAAPEVTQSIVVTTSSRPTGGQSTGGQTTSGQTTAGPSSAGGATSSNVVTPQSTTGGGCGLGATGTAIMVGGLLLALRPRRR